MGESKRRKKILGDEYFNPKTITFDFKDGGEPITIRCLKYVGVVCFDVPNNTLNVNTNHNYKEHEKSALAGLTALVFQRITNEHGIEILDLTFDFCISFQQVLTTEIINLYFCSKDATQFKFTTSIARKELQEIVRTHKSPKEHKRKPHSRMMRVGKGRTQLKEVEIRETIVNPGQK